MREQLFQEMLALFQILRNRKRELQGPDDHMGRILGAQPDHFRFHGPVEDFAISFANASCAFV